MACLGPSAWATQDPAPHVPAVPERELTPGPHDLKLGDGDRDGTLYIPRGYKPEVAWPLLVMLHGAGGTSRSTAYTFPLADEFGVIILAPDSRDEGTWDLLLHGYGPDVEFIGAALGHVQQRLNVDRQRRGLAGHSDGASYSLSLGIGTGETFGKVMAFSPGVMRPAEVHGKPKIFISHGLSDPVMPIDITSRVFVPRLRRLGYDVTYREYEGRHGVTPAIVREAFEWFSR
ncbi:MAG: phospholipase [Acidobacteria bacterium]|nr:phospholipase [Acidobacteriota bacterium]